MAFVTREFKICDRCQVEVQVYEIDDNGLMSDYEWETITLRSGRNYHLCPECGKDVVTVLTTMPDPELRAHLAEAQKEIDKGR